jgi:hypothetical protein
MEDRESGGGDAVGAELGGGVASRNPPLTKRAGSALTTISPAGQAAERQHLNHVAELTQRSTCRTCRRSVLEFDWAACQASASEVRWLMTCASRPHRPHSPSAAFITNVCRSLHLQVGRTASYSGSVSWCRKFATSCLPTSTGQETRGLSPRRICQILYHALL